MMTIILRMASALVLSILFTVSAIADDYAEARAELVAAYQAQEFPAMVEAAERAVAARPGHPGALFNLALANSLNGDGSGAFDVLDQLSVLGVDFGVANIGEFAALQEHERWPRYAARIAALHQPTGHAEVVASFDESDFVPEGIAVAGNGDLYLGSIRKGRLVRVGDEVATVSDRAGHWSVFGMRFDDEGDLWFASAAVAQMRDAGDDKGRTGLFRIDAETGAVKTVALLPPTAEQQVLGDLVIDGNTIYTTDSLGGGLYRYDVTAASFATVVEPGVWVSPQGLVLDASGTYLYVADYGSGLYRVALEDGSTTKLQLADGVMDFGIDGLYRCGGELIAIRNGYQPHQVIAYQLSDEGQGISASRVLASSLPEFDEPTLGAIVGDEFWFVANSHWNRFGPGNQLPDGLSGPIVLKLELTSHK